MKALISVHKKMQSSSAKNFRRLPSSGDSEFDLLATRNRVWVGPYGNQLSVRGVLLFLQNCARNRSLALGMCCHGLIIQADLGTEVLASNILINLYSKCNCIDTAFEVFHRMPARSIVSWNTMISANAQRGMYERAMDLFMQMHQEEIKISEFTLSSVLCACAAKLAVIECMELHAMAIKTAMDSNVFVGTAVLDVYAKCSMIRDASLVFDNMPEKSAVSWSSMVAGLAQNGLFEEALTLFHQAQKLDLERTQFTLSAAVSACATIAAMIEGAQLHSILIKAGFDNNSFVTSSLIDFYSRSGRIEDAHVIFQNVETNNIVIWNAMISGFSRHACTYEALLLFEKMQQIGLLPNEVTYASVLSACSHAGLVEKGKAIFDVLIRDNNVQSNALHYSCMVDILGRAGLIDEAWALICRMPFRGTASIWGSLLGSCKIHGHLDLAKVAAEHLFEIEPHNAGNHVLLANLYAANKSWGDVALTRKRLKDSGVKKALGKSWIEVKNKVHTFSVGEGNHPIIAEVYAKLEDLENEMKRLSYQAKIDCDLHDVSEEEKEMLLKHHSEKLALAFGLIALPSSATIRIYKNLRVCGDCHSVMKFASMITGRDIILRDTNRFHHFKGGWCSCRDFW